MTVILETPMKTLMFHLIWHRCCASIITITKDDESKNCVSFAEGTFALCSALLEVESHWQSEQFAQPCLVASLRVKNPHSLGFGQGPFAFWVDDSATVRCHHVCRGRPEQGNTPETFAFCIMH